MQQASTYGGYHLSTQNMYRGAKDKGVKRVRGMEQHSGKVLFQLELILPSGLCNIHVLRTVSSSITTRNIRLTGKQTASMSDGLAISWGDSKWNRPTSTAAGFDAWAFMCAAVGELHVAVTNHNLGMSIAAHSWLSPQKLEK